MASRTEHDHLEELGFRAWCGGVSGMARTHTHGDVELNFVLSGRVAYLIAGRRVVIEPGRIALMWAAVPHQSIRGDREARMVWVTFPLEWLGRWNASGEAFHALLNGGVLIDAKPEPSDGDRLRGWAAMMGRAESQWSLIVRLELEARLRRMMLDGCEAAGGCDVRDAAGMDAVQRMAAYIIRHASESISVGDVADHAALHPNHAMRLFKRKLGMTINGYLTRQRVAEAQRLLLTTDRSVLRIGFDVGFGSASQFHAAFKQHVGTTPNAHRRQMTRTGGIGIASAERL